MQLPWMTTRMCKIAIMTICCGLTSVLCGGRVQQASVEAIQGVGGKVWYDWELKNGRPTPNGKPPWPFWLLTLAGPDYFSNVGRVDLRGRATDKEITHIARLKHLEALILTGHVTDAGMAHLQSLSRLKVLYVGSFKVGDAGLAHVSRLKNLEKLGLTIGPFTEVGLLHLKDLPRIKSMSFVLSDYRRPGQGAAYPAIEKIFPNASIMALNYGSKMM